MPDTSAQLRRAPNSGRGFSLIELVVMIALLAIIGVSAIASTQSSGQSKQRLAARMLVSHLSSLRERAIASGSSTWATFNTSTDAATYSQTVNASIVAITDPATGAQLATRLGAGSEGALLAGIEIGTINGSTTTTTIGFDWMGRLVNNAGTLLTTSTTITITSSGTTPAAPAITITIQPETGLAAATW